MHKHCITSTSSFSRSLLTHCYKMFFYKNQSFITVHSLLFIFVQWHIYLAINTSVQIIKSQVRINMYTIIKNTLKSAPYWIALFLNKYKKLTWINNKTYSCVVIQLLLFLFFKFSEPSHKLNNKSQPSIWLWNKSRFSTK